MVDLTTQINLFAFALFHFQMFRSFHFDIFLSSDLFLCRFVLFSIFVCFESLPIRLVNEPTEETRNKWMDASTKYWYHIRRDSVAADAVASSCASVAKTAKVRKWWWMRFCPCATTVFAGWNGKRMGKNTNKICLRVFDWRFPMEKNSAHTAHTHTHSLYRWLGESAMNYEMSFECLVYIE